MSSAINVLPYDTTPEELRSLVTAILTVYSENISSAVKGEMVQYIANSIGEVKSKVTLECSGLSVYKLTDKIIREIKKSSPELLEKLVTSRSAHHRVQAGIVVKAVMLIKQLIYWLPNEQYFYAKKDQV